MTETQRPSEIVGVGAAHVPATRGKLSRVLPLAALAGALALPATAQAQEASASGEASAEVSTDEPSVGKVIQGYFGLDASYAYTRLPEEETDFAEDDVLKSKMYLQTPRVGLQVHFGDMRFGAGVQAELFSPSHSFEDDEGEAGKDFSVLSPYVKIIYGSSSDLDDSFALRLNGILSSPFGQRVNGIRLDLIPEVVASFKQKAGISFGVGPTYFSYQENNPNDVHEWNQSLIDGDLGLTFMASAWLDFDIFGGGNKRSTLAQAAVDGCVSLGVPREICEKKIDEYSGK